MKFRKPISIEQGGDVLALLTWFVVMVLSLVSWFDKESQININVLDITWFNIIFVLMLFMAFLVGYLLTKDSELIVKHASRHKNLKGTWLCALSVMALSSIFHFGLIGILAIITVSGLVRYYPLPTVLVAAWGFPVIGASIGMLTSDAPYMLENALLFGLFNSFAVFSNHRFIAEQAQKITSQQLVRELKATQFILSNTLKREERLRVARDLHDGLGHHLIALGLQLELAGHQTNDQAMPAIKQAKFMTTQLLADIRQSVSNYREQDSFQILDSIKLLTQDIPRLSVKLTASDNINNLNMRIATVIFRCTQEAITNVIKHANASNCHIDITYENTNLTLTITDNGIVNKNIIKGNGLLGMQERVNAAGGNLSLNPSSDGLQIVAAFNEVTAT